MKEPTKTEISRLVLGQFDEHEGQSLLESPEADAIMEEMWDESARGFEAKAMEKYADQVWAAVNPLLRKSGRSLSGKWYRVAATILLPMLLAATAIFLVIRHSDDKSGQLVWQTVEGERSRFTLEDGTVVWLNSLSELRFEWDQRKHIRLAELKGEACFQVTGNPDPFRVNLNATMLEVHGTTFNINAYPGNETMEITLVEGSVSLISRTRKGKQRQYLEPGQKATYQVITGETSITSVNTDHYTSWIDGKISFDNQSLEQIITVLQKKFGVPLDIEPTLMGTHRYTLTIKDESLEEVLTLLQLTSPISFEPRGDGFIIRKKRGQ